MMNDYISDESLAAFIDGNASIAEGHLITEALLTNPEMLETFELANDLAFDTRFATFPGSDTELFLTDETLAHTIFDDSTTIDIFADAELNICHESYDLSPADDDTMYSGIRSLLSNDDDLLNNHDTNINDNTDMTGTDDLNIPDMPDFI